MYTDHKWNFIKLLAIWFVVIVSYYECELCILLILTCLPGNTKEMPLADIVAHLTANRDDDVCSHIVGIYWNLCS